MTETIFGDVPAETCLLPAFKKLWLERLTDGTYKHAKGYLTGPDGIHRCCLGVAVTVAVELGLLQDDRTEAIRQGAVTFPGVLLPIEMKAMGLSLSHHTLLTRINDHNRPSEGMFYPQQVLDAVNALPERVG